MFIEADSHPMTKEKVHRLRDCEKRIVSRYIIRNVTDSAEHNQTPLELKNDRKLAGGSTFDPTENNLLRSWGLIHKRVTLIRFLT